MLPFGLGKLVANAIQPQIVYFRRQGIYLGAAAAFVLVGVVFLLIALFLALTYVMKPIFAALLCAGVCLVAAGILALIVFRRAKIKRVGNVTVLETEEDEEGDNAIALNAIKGVAGVALPLAVIGATAFMVLRQFGGGNDED